MVLARLRITWQPERSSHGPVARNGAAVGLKLRSKLLDLLGKGHNQIKIPSLCPSAPVPLGAYHTPFLRPSQKTRPTVMVFWSRLKTSVDLVGKNNLFEKSLRHSLRIKNPSAAL